MLACLLLFSSLLSGCWNTFRPVNPTDATKPKGIDRPTVEEAKSDLLKNCSHDCLRDGDITFVNQTSFPGQGTTASEFASGYGRFQYNFDVAVKQTNVVDNYRAVTVYTYNASNSGGNTYKFHSTDIRQLTSTFTQFGQWVYSSGDTDVWINMIGPDGNGYEVQYEITYHHSSWTKSETRTLESGKVVTVYGSNQTDSNRDRYLYIELERFVEGVGREEAGGLRVYPNGNIYWTILHGPTVRLERQQ